MDRRRTLTIGAALAVAAAPGAALAAKPSKSSVTIAAKPTTVTFGKATVIGGKATGNGAGGATITLQHDPFPFEGKFVTVTTTTANQQGDYLFAGIKPGV